MDALQTIQSLETTLLFAAIFGVLHVFLTGRVGIYRLKTKVSHGDNGDKELLRRMRAQGNFTEQVPIGLLLLLLNELNGLDQNTLLIIGSFFLSGRCLHYITVAYRNKIPLWWRQISMLLTLGSILAASLFLI